MQIKNLNYKIKLALVVLFSFSEIVYARAAEASRDYLKIDATASGAYQVIDSRVEIVGSIPVPNSNYVMAMMSFPDGTSQVFSWKTDANGVYDEHLLLRKGNGTYTVQLSYQKPAETPGFWSGVNLSRLLISNSDALDETFLLPSDVVQADDPEVIALAQSIVINAQTEMDAAHAIHNWVASHITYDYSEAARITTIPYKGDVYIVSVPGYVNGTALYTIHRGTGVCQDYSIVYASLARAVGLPTRVIAGSALGANSENHAWNEVLVNGTWMILDTTWDAGKTALQTYFNPDPSFFNKTHTKMANQPL